MQTDPDLGPDPEAVDLGGGPPQRDWEATARERAQESQRLRDQNRKINARALAAENGLSAEARDRLATIPVDQQEEWVKVLAPGSTPPAPSAPSPPPDPTPPAPQPDPVPAPTPDPAPQVQADPALGSLGEGGAGGDAPPIPPTSPPATPEDRVAARIRTAKSQKEVNEIVREEQKALRDKLQGKT